MTFCRWAACIRTGRRSAIQAPMASATPQPVGKGVDLALAVYSDCRSEIRDRVGMRDQWISRYVFGVVAFLGVSLGIEKLDDDTRIMLCLVMPAMSLIVAINVSAHVRSIEDLADYLRQPFNDFLELHNSQMPFYDLHTAKSRQKNEAKEVSRNRRRRLTHILSLHLPSLISLGYALVLLMRHYQFCLCFEQESLRLPIFFMIALICMALAVSTTWASFASRLATQD